MTSTDQEVQTPAVSERPGSEQWLHVVTHMDPRFGGLSAAVPDLASALVNATGQRMAIAGFCSPGELYAPPSNPHVSFKEWPVSRKAWWTDPKLTKEFQASVANAQGLHLHGLWEQSTAVAARASRSARKPYVLSAHGMLEPWALRNKRVKKWIYSALVERRNVNLAGCLHALTAAEAQHYRSFGATVPSVIIPNGVHIPASLTSSSFLAQNPSLRGKRIVLFLGRIHFKKGIDLLIRAWAGLAHRFPDAHLVLAGPDFEGTRAKLVELVDELGVQHSVLFTGMLRNELKWSALASAEFFVLPSHSEGLAVSGLEAMGVGLPVIFSTGCHLPEAEQLGAGWVVPPTTESLQRTLIEALQQTPLQNRAIGARGKAFVRDRYSWQKIAKQMGQVYAWLQGGDRPDLVEVIDGRSHRGTR